MSKRKTLAALSFTGKLLIGILIISPIILGFLFSFMTSRELAIAPPRFVPEQFTPDTYQRALHLVPLFGFLTNSIIVCAIVIIGHIVTCSLAAYAFAFFDFKFKRVLFMAVLATMMIPVDSIIISNFLTISHLGLTDTYTGLVAPFMTSAMGIFLMRQFFLTIPKELHEAAIIDGCGHFRFLLSIVMPISIPAIASLSVYIFILTYNQFLWPLLVTNSASMRTIQVGISILRDSEVVNYAVILAAAMMTLVPAVVVFIIGQKYLVKGMTAGSVKG